MVWCFAGLGLSVALLGFGMLLVHPLRWLRHLQPALLLRGCLASLCLFVALGLIGLAMAIAR